MAFIISAWVCLLLLAPAPTVQAGAVLTLVVPAAAGGPMDAVARHLATRMAEQSGQAVVVENRSGAKCLIGTQFVARSAPDGRTLLVGSSFMTSNALTFETAPHPIDDLRPLVKLTEMDIYLAGRAGLEVAGPADLERLARESPDGLNCAGLGGNLTLGCERLKKLLGGRVTLIPYNGVAPGVNDLAGGHVDLLFSPHQSLLPLAGTGKIQILAVLGDRPGTPPFEKAPLLKDTWPGFMMTSYHGIWAPPGTPDDLMVQLNQRINEALKDPQVIASLKTMGYRTVGGAPEILTRHLEAELNFQRRILEEIENASH
jgi:tripartite-type tricarboxylate transporter receptor subunit TctC